MVKIRAVGRLVCRRSACISLLVAWAVLAGCVSKPDVRQELVIHALQWPSPPDDPRIQWVKEIRSYRDAGISKGFWERVVEFVTGASEAPINKPYGVFCDRDRRLFIVDVGGGVVHLLDQKEGRYTVIGGEDGGAFHTPIAVAEDDAGYAYITDSAAGLIFRYGLKDKTLTPFTPFRLERPTGIAWSSSTRTLYVTDTMAHQIVAFDLEGKERYRIGARGYGAGEFNYPTDLFVDKGGRLFVTDSMNARIQIFSPQGEFLRTFGQPGDSSGRFAKPKGVAVDSEGHIYVCDALLDTVQIFDETGQLLLVFGSRGNNPGELAMPAGIYIDGNDTIYVADAFNHRIQIFQYLPTK